MNPTGFIEPLALVEGDKKPEFKSHSLWLEDFNQKMLAASIKLRT